MKNNLIWGLVHVDDTQHMYIVYEFFVDLRLSTGLLFSMSVALTWVSHLVLDFSDKTIPCLETPGISTIALIALWCVPIALWFTPNLYNVCKKSSTWHIVGWWGLSCHLLQKSSHCYTGVLYADCVLTLHDAQTKLLLPDWADPRLGVDSLSLVSPTTQFVGTTAVFANRELSPRLSPDPVQVWPALFQLH